MKIEIKIDEKLKSALYHYDNDKISYIDAYYTRINSDEKISESYHNYKMRKLYNDDRDKWKIEHRMYHLHEEIYQDYPSRIGMDNSDSFNVFLRRATHSYNGSETIDGILYGNVDIIKTPLGEQYLHIPSGDLYLEPVAMNDKIFYMKICTKDN